MLLPHSHIKGHNIRGTSCNSCLCRWPKWRWHLFCDCSIFPLISVCPLFALLRFVLFCTKCKYCPEVSLSSFLNKALVGGFPCSHCGFRAVGCHFHLLFHHVGVTKPHGILLVSNSYMNSYTSPSENMTKTFSFWLQTVVAGVKGS